MVPASLGVKSLIMTLTEIDAIFVRCDAAASIGERR
jgi:hypothetical protein